MLLAKLAPVTVQPVKFLSTIDNNAVFIVSAAEKDNIHLYLYVYNEDENELSSFEIFKFMVNSFTLLFSSFIFFLNNKLAT